MAIYLIENGPMQTTVSQVAVATGTALKTMLQFKASATIAARVKEWGCSFDGSLAATPGKVELIETDVAATVTAHVTADITKLDGLALIGGDPTTNLIQVGTAATGYTASAEGSITAVRKLDGAKYIAPTNQYEKQYPLGDEPVIQIGKFLRIRVLFGTTVNFYGYIKVEI